MVYLVVNWLENHADRRAAKVDRNAGRLAKRVCAHSALWICSGFSTDLQSGLATLDGVDLPRQKFFF